MAYVKGLRTIPLYSEEAIRLLDSTLISVRSSGNPSNPYGCGKVFFALEETCYLCILLSRAPSLKINKLKTTCTVGPLSTPLTSVSPRAGQDQLQCLACGVTLVSRDEQVNHYKLDWHRFNLSRKTKGLAPLSEDEFESLGGKTA